MEVQITKKIQTFFSRFPLVIYKKRERINNYLDDKNAYVYFLQKGHVRQFFLSARGDEVTTCLFKPYSFFPMMEILNNIPPKGNFEAFSPDVSIRKAPKEKVLFFLKENPDVLLDLTKRFGRGLVYLTLMMEKMFFTSATERIHGLFEVYARRFGKKTKEGVLLTIPFTHREIGNMIGLTRETVSREISQMIKKKEIKLTKNSRLLVLLHG